MLVLDPPALALVGIVTVESRKADLAEPKLARPQPEGFGHVLAELRRARRLDLARDRGGVHQRLVDLVVLLAVREDLRRIDRPDPLSVRGLLDVLRLQRVHPSVEGYVLVVLAYARDRCQVFWHRDVVVRIPVQSTRTRHNVMYFFSRHCPSPVELVCVGVYAQFKTESRQKLHELI